MAYKIIVSPKAQREIVNAIDYYLLYSEDAPIKFIELLKDCYNSLGINPFFRVRYKNVRSLKIQKFPYTLFFIINESQDSVKILSCFHNKRNPNKRPRY